MSTAKRRTKPVQAVVIGDEVTSLLLNLQLQERIRCAQLHVALLTRGTACGPAGCRQDEPHHRGGHGVIPRLAAASAAADATAGGGHSRGRSHDHR